MAGAYIEIPWGQEKEVYTTTFGGREMILGQPGLTPDGREFRWAFSGGAIGAGQRVESSPAVAADDQDLAVQAAAAVDDTTVSITTAGAVTANLYADGYLMVNDGAGEGHHYAIKSHPLTTGAATLVITLHEKVREALTTGTSLVGLVKNPYKDVVIGGAASNAGATVGVASTEVTDNDYFWCQVSGFSVVLAEAPNAVIGDGIEMGVDVAGTFQLFDVSADTDKRPLGELLQVAANAGDSMGVMLNIQ
jgi:hypothetical protein